LWHIIDSRAASNFQLNHGQKVGWEKGKWWGGGKAENGKWEISPAL